MFNYVSFFNINIFNSQCSTQKMFKNSINKPFKLIRLLHLKYVEKNVVNPIVKYKEKHYVPNFESMIKDKCFQARRSLLVQLKSDNSCAQFKDFCTTFGKINNIVNYVLPHSELFFSLVEFEDIKSISDVLQSCSVINNDVQSLPCTSPFLIFNHTSKNSLHVTDNSRSTFIESGYFPNEIQIANYLMAMDSVSDQIMKLYEITKLDDLGFRLRFLTAYQIECALAGIFPGSQCHLFGSSVNGCGRINSDLDLVWNFKNSANISVSYLEHQIKTTFTNDRFRLQKYMEILADFLQHFMPGCSHVIRILQAKVPIIKYKQIYSGLDCDLSLRNNNSVNMSKLLYTLSGIDYRIRPLIFTIKHWAEKVNVTNPFPGHWISNFSLNLMVLFYLQQIRIIPKVDQVTILNRVCEDDSCEIECTILYDVIQHFVNDSNNSTSLSDILIGFFEYYLKFDFELNGISLNSGEVVKKSNREESLYIVNPLEQELNVSKNVSLDEVKNFKIKLTEAINTLSNKLNKRNEDWGLISLMKENTAKNSELSFRLNFRTKHRLVNISDLFNDS